LRQVIVQVYGTMIDVPTVWQARFTRDTTDRVYRGVAVEGIAMGLVLAELTTPFSHGSRALEFADDQDGRYRLLAYLGVGMALACLKRHPKLLWSMMRLDDREMVFDGYGFCKGYFAGRRYVDQRRIPRRLAGSDLMMFDEGLGRAIWIASGAEINRVVDELRSFPDERQHSLWGVIGISSTFAGVCDEAGYEALTRRSGVHANALARGCAVGCLLHAGNGWVPDYTHVAAHVFWNASVAEVAARFTRYWSGSHVLPSGDSRFAYVYRELERDAAETAGGGVDGPAFGD
jgi:hypothetical protein